VYTSWLIVRLVMGEKQEKQHVTRGAGTEPMSRRTEHLYSWREREAGNRASSGKEYLNYSGVICCSARASRECGDDDADVLLASIALPFLRVVAARSR